MGETGTIKDTLGEYVVTIESVEAHDTFDGIEPEHEDFQFVLINFTVENVGEKELEGDAISIPILITETGSRASNVFSIESIDRIKDEPHPGEEDSGQMIFHSYKSDNYELTFGLGMGSLSSQVTWEFGVE